MQDYTQSTVNGARGQTYSIIQPSSFIFVALHGQFSLHRTIVNCYRHSWPKTINHGLYPRPKTPLSLVVQHYCLTIINEDLNGPYYSSHGYTLLALYCSCVFSLQLHASSCIRLMYRGYSFHGNSICQTIALMTIRLRSWLSSLVHSSRGYINFPDHSSRGYLIQVMAHAHSSHSLFTPYGFTQSRSTGEDINSCKNYNNRPLSSGCTWLCSATQISTNCSVSPLGFLYSAIQMSTNC